MKNKNVFNDSSLRAMIMVFMAGMFVLIFLVLSFVSIPHADHYSENDFNFEIIFQNENEFGNLRVSTGTAFHSPDNTLMIDAEGQAWTVEGIDLADDTNVLVVINDNNTINNTYDDVIVGMYRVAQ